MPTQLLPTLPATTATATALPADGAAAGADPFARLLGGGAGLLQGGDGHARDPLASALDAALDPASDPLEHDAHALLAWLPWMQDTAAAAAGTATAPPADDANAPLPAPITAVAITAVVADEADLAAPAALPSTPAFGAMAAATLDRSEPLPPPVPTAVAMQSTATAAMATRSVVDARLLDAGEVSEPRLDLRSDLPTHTVRGDAPRAVLELGLPPSTSARFADDAADGIAARMQWMAERGIGRAQIRLSPAELGTIDIQLETSGKKVRAEFVSANADVRQVIESQLPRLRELFAAQGMTLTHADVGHQHGDGAMRGDRGDDAAARPAFGDRAPGSAADEHADAPATSVRTRVGLLDEYA